MSFVLTTCCLLVSALAFRVYLMHVNWRGLARHVMERTPLLLLLHLLHQVLGANAITVAWPGPMPILSADKHVIEVQTKHVLLVHALRMSQTVQQYMMERLHQLHCPLMLRQIHRRQRLHHAIHLLQIMHRHRSRYWNIVSFCQYLLFCSVELFVSISTCAPTNMFYADQTVSVCKKYWPAGNGLPCGGSQTDLSLKLYNSLDLCYATKIPLKPSLLVQTSRMEMSCIGQKYYVN